MENGPSEPGPSAPAGAANEVTQTVRGRDQHPATDVVRHGPGVPAILPAGQAGQVREDGWRADLTPEIVRYGPGVPATPSAGRAELTAERAWHATEPGRPPRRWPRLGRVLGWALTAILLAASGVLLYSRFHREPFHVTDVAITQQAHNGCGVDVTGRITTNGAAGMVSYQWLFEPGQQPPQPLGQSVTAGQRAVYVTIAVEGVGHGSASESVILQVLDPDTKNASAVVEVGCP